MIIKSATHPNIHVEIIQRSSQKWAYNCYINNILLHGGNAYTLRSLASVTNAANNWIHSAETAINLLTKP